MNYLGLVGLLGLTGAKDGPPVQSGGQIADLGGGALMAAFGVMAALHERRRSGEGQFVDVSMADGALSWLAMVAGRYFCDGEVPRRGEQQLAGGLALLPALRGGRRLGHLRRARAEVLGRLLRAASSGPTWSRASSSRRARTAGARSPRSSAAAAASEWQAFNDEHDCCIEPVLDVDEALDSELVRAREMVVEIEQPELRPGPPARRPDQAQPHPRRPDPPGAGLRRAHRGGPARGRLLRRGDRGDAGVGRRRRARAPTRATDLPAHERAANGDLLRMGELAEASGVPAPTIKHYLREGLLPEPVKTSRNMAYYPPEFVDRIKLIKQLQEERFMPLRAIKAVLDEDPERARALVELEDRILDRALAGERTRTSAAEVRERYGVPKEVLDRLEELEVLSPNSRGYSPSDVKIIEAISRFRAGGYDEEIGFTVYDTLRYKSALEDAGPRGGRRW